MSGSPVRFPPLPPGHAVLLFSCGSYSRGFPVKSRFPHSTRCFSLHYSHRFGNFQCGLRNRRRAQSVIDSSWERNFMATKKKARKTRARGKADFIGLSEFQRKGLGANTGGQSGDLQGISGSADVDSEGVAELLEEGQSFEAEVVSGVENAPDPDVSEVVTHEVSEDDVPEEYRDKD